MAWKPYRATPAHKSARSFINTETGEILSRRQYDKRYGILKAQGFKSYETKAETRQAAGLKGIRGLAVTSTRKFEQTGRQHISIQTPVSKLEQTLAKLEREKGFKSTNVGVRITDGKGNYWQSKSYDPRNPNAAKLLTREVNNLKAKYLPRRPKGGGGEEAYGLFVQSLLTKAGKPRKRRARWQYVPPVSYGDEAASEHLEEFYDQFGQGELDDGYGSDPWHGGDDAYAFQMRELSEDDIDEETGEYVGNEGEFGVDRVELVWSERAR